MRFWNALVAIALLPIVAADFHFGFVTAARFADPIFGGSGVYYIWWVLLPWNHDGCLQSLGKSDGGEAYVQLGYINGTICGEHVIVLPTLDGWRTSNSSGACYPTYPGTNKMHYASCTFANSYVYIDLYWCDSYLCGK
ncbi:uncharacterized protein EI90DRAFT_3013593 [Cantharellus anzutake]|uniref:uncharacterized protein n=1 Tax=Cantharellus anzutake TaxID=1750568 RepID=UPI001908B9A4|nr:uncharacterized protein EI90DRAFT_3013593 [Cantharellus anzutake]KAF8337350.1 hypothetical protein EI90DRAFT_3013593 [Cantharellus anzutake]